MVDCSIPVSLSSDELDNSGQDDMWEIFDTFDVWSTEFDLQPPIYDNCGISVNSDLSLSASPLSVFADETAVSRWAVPSRPNSLFQKISEQHKQKRRRDCDNASPDATEDVREVVIPTEFALVPVAVSIPVELTSTISPRLLTASQLRRQQNEWFHKSLQAKHNNKHKKTQKRNNIPSSNSSISSSSSASSPKQTEAQASRPEIEIVPINDVLDSLFSVSPISTCLSELSQDRGAEIRMVEVLSYTSNFMRAINMGNFDMLNELLQRTVLPSCPFQLYITPNTYPSKIVPRDCISEYFRILSEAIPDALWRVEDTKLRRGKPRTAVSNFSRSGTLLNNAARDWIVAHFQPHENEPFNKDKEIEKSDEKRRTISGTVYLELDSDLRINGFNVVLHDMLPGMCAYK